MNDATTGSAATEKAEKTTQVVLLSPYDPKDGDPIDAGRVIHVTASRAKQLVDDRKARRATPSDIAVAGPLLIDLVG